VTAAGHLRLSEIGTHLGDLVGLDVSEAMTIALRFHLARNGADRLKCVGQ
jgi:hypothetical protein